jgi:hypothetical protein
MHVPECGDPSEFESSANGACPILPLPAFRVPIDALPLPVADASGLTHDDSASVDDACSVGTPLVQFLPPPEFDFSALSDMDIVSASLSLCFSPPKLPPPIHYATPHKPLREKESNTFNSTPKSDAKEMNYLASDAKNDAGMVSGDETTANASGRVDSEALLLALPLTAMASSLLSRSPLPLSAGLRSPSNPNSANCSSSMSKLAARHAALSSALSSKANHQTPSRVENSEAETERDEESALRLSPTQQQNLIAILTGTPSSPSPMDQQPSQQPCFANLSPQQLPIRVPSTPPSPKRVLLNDFATCDESFVLFDEEEDEEVRKYPEFEQKCESAKIPLRSNIPISHDATPNETIAEIAEGEKEELNFLPVESCLAYEAETQPETDDGVECDHVNPRAVREKDASTAMGTEEQSPRPACMAASRTLMLILSPHKRTIARIGTPWRLCCFSFVCLFVCLIVFLFDCLVCLFGLFGLFGLFVCLFVCLFVGLVLVQVLV